MTTVINTEQDLRRGLRALKRLDPRFAPLLALAGEPPLRRRPNGFADIASIVVSQQLSVASAAAIWGRLSTALDPLDAPALLRARTPKLRRVGLSGPKIRSLKAIARAINSKELDLDSLGDCPADEAHRALCTVHGIGPWTADIYLLTCLGHSDAWPAGDLALQEAAKLAFSLRARPSTKDMGPLAEPWRPWRSVAARVLWSYYRAIKGRSGAPISPIVPQQNKG